MARGRYAYERLVKLEAKLSIPEPMTGVAEGKRGVPASAGTALMTRIKHGDRDAFGQWILVSQDRLVNFLIRLCGRRELAEDLAQESYLRFFHALGQRPVENLEPIPYLFRIAVNLLRSRERRQNRFAKIKSVFGWLEEDRRRAMSSGRPSEDMLHCEVVDQVQAALSDLPLRFREPLILRQMEDWSYREIASHLGIREGTVKSRIARAKLRLKQRLQPYFEGA